jgi:hypothetical protein
MTKDEELTALNEAAAVLAQEGFTRHAKVVTDIVERLKNIPVYVVSIHKLGKKDKSLYLMSDGSIQGMKDTEALVSAAHHRASALAAQSRVRELEAKIAELTK